MRDDVIDEPTPTTDTAPIAESGANEPEQDPDTINLDDYEVWRYGGGLA